MDTGSGISDLVTIVLILVNASQVVALAYIAVLATRAERKNRNGS